MTTPIASNLHAVRARITKVAQSHNRRPDEITLLAASKTNPAENLREAWLAGQRIFGENYLQEALAKMQHLTDLPIEWHFIGPIQSNKTRRISENFFLGSQRGQNEDRRSTLERPVRILTAAANLLTSQRKRGSK